MTKSRYTVGDGSIERARALRRDATAAETRLSSVLRGSALDGHKFRRQQRLGPFYADFVCQAARLVVEIDGETHVGNEERDARRTAFLEREGYHVLRFSNADVMENVEGVAQVICSAFEPSPSHPALPGGPSIGWTAPRAVQVVPGARPTRCSLPRGERRS